MVTPVTKRRAFQALRKRQLLGLCVLLIILKLDLGVRVGLRVSDNAALTIQKQFKKKLCKEDHNNFFF